MELLRATRLQNRPSISISFIARLMITIIIIIFYFITIIITNMITNVITNVTMIKGPNANKWSSSLTDSDLVKGTVVLVNMNVPR